MITEDYVSFEIAKLLKEKGFNEKCYMYWDEVTNIMEIADEYAPFLSTYIPAPTLQMAMKWLRERGFIIAPIPDFRFNKLLFTNIIIKINDDPQQLVSELYNTYEEACEGGIKYCLENLI